MKRFWILLKNEGKLSIRDMNMVIFAVLMPLAILAVLGFLCGGRPAYDGADYTFVEQSFGAVCAVSMCALSPSNFKKNSGSPDTFFPRTKSQFVMIDIISFPITSARNIQFKDGVLNATARDAASIIQHAYSTNLFVVLRMARLSRTPSLRLCAAAMPKNKSTAIRITATKMNGNMSVNVSCRNVTASTLTLP